MFNEYPKHINHPDGTFTVVNNADHEAELVGSPEAELVEDTETETSETKEAISTEEPEGEV